MYALNMVSAIFAVVVGGMDPGSTFYRGDGSPAVDPMRPVTMVRRDGFDLQYTTRGATATAIEIREGDMPRTAFGHRPDGTARTVTLDTKAKTHHYARIQGLKPGRRYFYRIIDPTTPATETERRWGADDRHGREWAISTLAPSGRKTVIHLPVKVLLMPNVLTAASAIVDGKPVPPPPRMTETELKRIRDEYAESSRFFWVNSGMRLWVDYQIVVDDRWQRWSPPTTTGNAFYDSLPASRSYPGRDYADPGGGDFTIVDMKDPLKVGKEPIREDFPYSSQVEQAFPRRYNAQAKRWEFYNSGGGTFGVDGFPSGFPGRSQYLGGGDTAWLATHEVHHSLESHGEWSLSHRSDDRITFNHPEPRRRVRRDDGGFAETAWTTSGRHGEHWDVMAFWDRQLSDAQWLRMYFGRTVTVADRDEDGFPDDDPRLPLDERRFGSEPSKAMTDGAINDLTKAMFSNWAPAPLQSTWTKPQSQMIRPNPRRADSDGDGISDGIDPIPLFAVSPIIPNGRGGNWEAQPPAGERPGWRFWHRANDDGYYGRLRIEGDWDRLEATFDGEGKGVYSGEGVLGFVATPTADGANFRPAFGGTPEFRSRVVRDGDATVIEFEFGTRGSSPWFWRRGGHEIGVSMNLWRRSQGFPLYETYRPVYFRMDAPRGVAEMPSSAPAEVRGDAVDLASLKIEGGWRREGANLVHTGGEESAAFVDGLALTEFDLWAEIEGRQDLILGAFLPGSPMSAGSDYIAFFGGYANTQTKLRIFGEVIGDSGLPVTPGRHRIQLTRRGGEIWFLVDGKAVAFAKDPNPTARVDRLALIGGYGGNQRLHSLRIRR